jgi:hypothetical protein
MLRYSRLGLALLILTQLAHAEVILVSGTGPVITIEENRLLFTGNNGSVTYGQNNVTEITGDFAEVTTHLLDPDEDAEVEGSRGDVTLDLGAGDPVLEAEVYIKFWDVEISGQTVRKGWFKVFRTTTGGEDVFMSGNVDPLREVADIGNITYDDNLDSTYAGEIPSPTLAVHGSDHMQAVVDMLNGTSNGDVTFTLAASEDADRWAIVYNCVEASFDGLRDRSDAAYAESTISEAAYSTIMDEVDYAEEEYDYTTTEGTHGDNCEDTMDDLYADITTWEASGDITDADVADFLQEYCLSVADCCETNSNYFLPVTWGNVRF